MFKCFSFGCSTCWKKCFFFCRPTSSASYEKAFVVWWRIETASIIPWAICLQFPSKKVKLAVFSFFEGGEDERNFKDFKWTMIYFISKNFRNSQWSPDVWESYCVHPVSTSVRGTRVKSLKITSLFIQEVINLIHDDFIMRFFFLKSTVLKQKVVRTYHVFHVGKTINVCKFFGSLVL